jgi:hypothetical protein
MAMQPEPVSPGQGPLFWPSPSTAQPGDLRARAGTARGVQVVPGLHPSAWHGHGTVLIVGPVAARCLLPAQPTNPLPHIKCQTPPSNPNHKIPHPAAAHASPQIQPASSAPPFSSSLFLVGTSS